MTEKSAETPSSTLLHALGDPLVDRRLQVLRALGECGSISQAAREVGVSYKAAWQAIDTLSNLAGVPVVQKSVGGAGGGGAKLTPAGQALLKAAQAMAQARVAVVQQLQSAWPVQRLGIQTSMRNQWPCSVQQVQVDGPLALVTVCSQVHPSWSQQVRMTAESAQLLGLPEAAGVIALCKATAVVVAGVAALQQGAVNTWLAKAVRIAPGALGDEVTVEVAPSVHLVGFAAADSGLCVGDQVSVHVPPAALVLALAH